MPSMTLITAISFLSVLNTTPASAQSDYQMLQPQTALDDEMEPNAYNVRDVDSFKAKALERTSPITPSAVPPAMQSAEVEAKIKKVLNAFGKKIDTNLKADLEKALKSEFISHQEAKVEAKPHKIQMVTPVGEKNTIIESAPESIQTKPIVQEQKPAVQELKAAAIEQKPVVVEQKLAAPVQAQIQTQTPIQQQTQTQPQVVQQTAEIKVGDASGTATRIAEINKALKNPQLEWNEFERLLDERKNLEKQMKAASAGAPPATQGSSNN